MGCTKGELKGKFIAVNAYTKKEERSQINNLAFHLKILAKEAQTNPKARKGKEIKIKAQINETENKNQQNQKLVL